MRVICTKCKKEMIMYDNFHNGDGTITVACKCTKCQVCVDVVIGMKWSKKK
jgi:hypothetical protein